ncbi:hypothetical protein DERP_006427 [Dermatophagoides pteronyssinus]|uniref:Uncharacterized protein n=1 Tax=Dermatophagoides pteronyssinus TaxID=6956 RepID=A0ABQ8IQJ8_DERPT|nr:hypothetical protein DERP_006427 [Dermatophagoides pteronyssinus]
MIYKQPEILKYYYSIITMNIIDNASHKQNDDYVGVMTLVFQKIYLCIYFAQRRSVISSSIISSIGIVLIANNGN